MMMVLYTYEVPVEKQDDYLRITRDEIKPFWESRGCEAYRVWQSSEASTRFVKEMIFSDAAAMRNVLGLAEAGPIKKLFSQFATSVSRAAYARLN
ncbi:MAG: antibiotic biosynthesis monooxygenase [Syntrophorhabdales bacterium]